MDTEADSRHHYPEKVCLVQVGVPGNVYVLDPLAAIDLAPLGEALADLGVQKVLHGADFDLRGLNRDWGFVFHNVYDTNIAARFAGLERFGLAALVEDLLGINIPKDQKLQRADWSKRPLSAAALDYAAADVAHLFAVRAALDARIKAQGREGWVREEMERLEEVRYTPPDPETAFLGVKGARFLSGRELAVLKEIHALREAEARRLDRPMAFVIPADAMVYLARHPEASLEEVPGLGVATVRRLGRQIRAALRRGMEAPPYRRPEAPHPPRPRPTDEQNARLARLKAWRMGLGKQLSLDPSLLWSMRSLERLAREPGSLDAELESPELRRWQRREFGDSLGRVLARG